MASTSIYSCFGRCLIGINVFVVLISGTVLSLIVGVATGTLAVSEMFSVIGDGVTGMYDITVISIVVACIVSLVKEYGGIQFILNLIKSKISGRRGGELGIAGLSLLVDACTANNTVAIVMAGPIAKEISEEFDIDPKRSASLLDIFTSVGQGLIPYGAQLLSAATLTALTPFEIIPYLYYPISWRLVQSALFCSEKNENVCSRVTNVRHSKKTKLRSRKFCDIFISIVKKCEKGWLR